MENYYEKRGYLLEDFRLFHLRDAQGPKVEHHYHEFHKIVLLVSGSGGYVVEGRRYLLKPGDVVMVGSRCVHRPEFESGSPYERIIIYISPEYRAQVSTENCDLSQIFTGPQGHVLRPSENGRKRIFELALQRAGLEPEDVWYIGDQYKADVEGARNAKITPVWYVGASDLPYEEKDDVLTVRSWAELKECLE